MPINDRNRYLDPYSLNTYRCCRMFQLDLFRYIGIIIPNDNIIKVKTLNKSAVKPMLNLFPRPIIA